MNDQNLSDLATKQKITGNVLPTLFGWPASGGVWVLKPTPEQFEEYNRVPPTTDMEVHCAALERIGATFYTDSSECEQVRAMDASLPSARGQA